MTTPTSVLELSLTNPGDTQVWQDESRPMRTFTVTRGTDDELARATAGHGEFVQDNLDGRYTYGNTASPLYPNLIPTRTLRLSLVVPSDYEAFTSGSSYNGGPDVHGGGDLVFTVFTGYIEDWPQAWPDPSDSVAEVTLEAVDGFLGLGGADYDEAWGAGAITMRSGARVERVLDAVGWPDDLRVIDTGTVFIIGFFGSAIEVHEKSLDYLHKIAETEGGRVFMDGSGRLVFQDSESPIDLDPGDVYGDVPGEIRYSRIEILPGGRKIKNQIKVSASPENFPPVEVVGATSIGRHFPKTHELTLLAASANPDESGSILETRATELRDYYETPRQRVVSLDLRPRTSDEWIRVLRHEIGDHILVRRRPPQGDMIEQVSRIEGISIRANDIADYQVTWTLSAYVQPHVSLLTENQQSLETGTAGWVADVNCSIAQTTDVARAGLASLLLTPTVDDGSVLSARTDPLDGIDVTVGAAYRAVASFRNGPSGVGFPFSARLEIRWYSAALALVSTTAGDYSNVSGSAWKSFEIEGEAPATAAHGVLVLSIDPLLSGFGGDYVADLIDFYSIDELPSSFVPEGAWGSGDWGSMGWGG